VEEHSNSNGDAEEGDEADEAGREALFLLSAIFVFLR
jgi:hypothetical protein